MEKRIYVCDFCGKEGEDLILYSIQINNIKFSVCEKCCKEFKKFITDKYFTEHKEGKCFIHLNKGI